MNGRKERKERKKGEDDGAWVQISCGRSGRFMRVSLDTYGGGIEVWGESEPLFSMGRSTGGASELPLQEVSGSGRNHQ